MNTSLIKKKEIGGYIELERYPGEPYHKNAIALNSGRDCLKYLIRLRKIQTIFLPDYLCSVIYETCKKENVAIKYYSIGENFLPDFKNLEIKDSDFVYVINYYGLLSEQFLAKLNGTFPHRIILDNSQAFFLKPQKGFDVIYTCRKFFGVPDGGYLYTYDKSKIESKIELAKSSPHFAHILGRFESNGSEYYKESGKNEKRLEIEDLRAMSKLTANLLNPIDYQSALEKRLRNWLTLDSSLRKFNLLDLTVSPLGSYMYPFMIEQGKELKSFLIKHSIYVPTLWPNTIEEAKSNSWAYRYAELIVPLPIDQRYDKSDMNVILVLIDDFFHKQPTTTKG